MAIECETTERQTAERETGAQVAVIIAVRNGIPFVNEAVASVLQQGDALERVIVVDDGSTDDTVASLSAISDPRLVVMGHAGAGVSDARNAGVAASRAPWLMFLDADDKLAPGAIARLLRRRSPDAVAVYGDYERIDETGHVFGTRGLVRARRRKPSGDILPALLGGNFIINGGVVLCARDRFLEVGGFRSGLALCEDWLLWCRLATTGVIEYVADLVLFYRVHRASVMMRRRWAYADFSPAVEAIFADPVIVSRIPPARLAALRTSGESSLMIYCAQQAARARAWRETTRLTFAAITHSPRNLLRVIARVIGAVIGF